MSRPHLAERSRDGGVGSTSSLVVGTDAWTYCLCMEKFDVQAARRRVALLVLVPAVVAVVAAVLLFELLQPGNWF